MLTWLLLIPYFYSCLCFIGNETSSSTLADTRKSVAILVDRGETLAYKGEIGASLIFINQALAIDPKNAHAYLAKAYDDYKIGDRKLALSDYDKSIAYGGNNYCVFFLRGCLLSDFGRSKEAIEDFNKAIAFNPTGVDAYFQRARCYYDLKLYKSAIADTSKAISIEPKYAEVYCARAHALFADGKYKLAMADANKCLRLDPHHAGAFLVQSWVYEQAGQKDLAMSRLKACIAFNPKDKEALAGISRLNALKRKVKS